MSNDNRISAELNDDVKQQIFTKISEIEGLLPFLFNLTPEDRRKIPHIATERGAMDEDFARQMAAHPELLPNFVDAAELERDRALRSALLDVQARLDALQKKLSDTTQAVGSDIYQAYLAYYANVQQAAKRGVSAASAILADLRRFFPRSARTPVPPETP
ncbi:MAG: hypothetical protein PHE55_22775 [Methylococcaceae bacterium]|nr:hypothetical protein [Methylococcaceae bacterium]